METHLKHMKEITDKLAAIGSPIKEEYQVEPEKVKLGDGRTAQAIGIGKVHIDMEFKISNMKRFVMNNVLFVPNLTCNLFSVRAAVAMGNSIKFGKYKSWIRNSHGCSMWDGFTEQQTTNSIAFK